MSNSPTKSQVVTMQAIDKDGNQAEMDPQTAEIIESSNKFFKEIGEESDRGVALISAAMLDQHLGQMIKNNFIREGKVIDQLMEGGFAPLNTFSARIKLCYALGLITEHEYQQIEKIRKIRNKFGHELYGLSFENEPIRSICQSLKVRKMFTDHPRDQFCAASTDLMMAFQIRTPAIANKKLNEPAPEWPTYTLAGSAGNTPAP